MTDGPDPTPRPPRNSKLTASLDSGQAAIIARLARYRTLAGPKTVTAGELAAEVIGRFADQVGPVELPRLAVVEAAMQAADGSAA